MEKCITCIVYNVIRVENAEIKPKTESETCSLTANSVEKLLFCYRSKIILFIVNVLPFVKSVS